MKSFSSLKELMTYGKNCPICQKERSMEIGMGPDLPGSFSTNFCRLAKDFEYQDDKLIFDVILCISHVQQQFTITIDAYTGTFSKSIPKIIENYEFPAILKTRYNGVADFVEDLFFHLHSWCSHCSGIDTNPIFLNEKTNKITSISLDREVFYIKDDSAWYFLEYEKDFSSCEMIPVDSQQLLLWDEPGRTIPISDEQFDLSNKEEIISKLKTYFLFS